MRERRPVVVAIGCGLGVLLCVMSLCIAGGLIYFQPEFMRGRPIPQPTAPAP
ncbi:MAG: hypothetical protein K1X94_18920 [Sandaracinaceae bacterium]|nr:hypothetical protein [Sandaracinaceae bacterium]